MPDFAAARAALPGMTRSVFGEDVTIIPRISGKMAERDDPDRLILEGVRGRFDAEFAVEEIGGGRDNPTHSRAIGETATVSIERRLLLWEPRQGDRLRRVHPVTAVLEAYRIQRVVGLHGNVLLLFLSPL